VAAFVTLKEGNVPSQELREELKDHVTLKIGPIARPDDIIFTGDLPKTRSGKIMRRLLKDIAEGKALGDTTTLADPTVITRLKDEYAFFDEITQSWRTVSGLMQRREEEES
jgi:acetyl-CoA synthetase